jgi:hypothetical protein
MLEKVAEQSANLSRPLTREQARQNAEFLRHLRRIGNVRGSARQAGVGFGAIQHRRNGHPGFALRRDCGRCSAAGVSEGAANVGKRRFVIIPYNKSNLVWLT